MTAPTRTRKTTATTLRTATILVMPAGPNVFCLMEDGALTNSYGIKPQASDFGAAFHLTKAIGADGIGGEEYDVLLHGKESSCTCPGHIYRNKCKHVDALTALVQSGKLSVAAPSREPGEDLEDL